MDKASTKELLAFILESLALVKKRFQTIKSSDDFLQNEVGLEKLDAIAMRLQSIGEALKNLMKREKSLLLKVADETYWSEIIKTRDFISHHYVAIDAEIVFDICSSELEVLEKNIVALQGLVWFSLPPS
ncbi:MAG: DUF86 domain-containing protein [Campylobacterales bacterium]|nr:DUF86 domain-containing protein [Campylobacterales bacterium]